MKYWQAWNTDDFGLWIAQPLFSEAEKSHLDHFYELFCKLQKV